jgi:hypothetical protein
MVEFDLEDELANSITICEKVLCDEDYAKDLYRALSNMQWRKREVIPMVKPRAFASSYAADRLKSVRAA